MANKAKIILNRKAAWMNRLRGYRVIIDGQMAGTIRNGASEEFQLDPGQHRISCKINWCSSREYEVNLKEGETEYLRVKSGLKYYYLFVIPFFAFLGYNIYFDFAGQKKSEHYDNLLLLLALPLLLYLFYYLSFGRKDYLVLGKDTTGLFAN